MKRFIVVLACLVSVESLRADAAQDDQSMMAHQKNVKTMMLGQPPAAIRKQDEWFGQNAHSIFFFLMMLMCMFSALDARVHKTHIADFFGGDKLRRDASNLELSDSVSMKTSSHSQERVNVGTCGSRGVAFMKLHKIGSTTVLI